MLELIVPFALGAVVLMLSGLVSGVVREAPLSVPIKFRGLGRWSMAVSATRA